MNEFLTLREGTSPLVLSIPHAGTEIPDDIARHMNETGRAIPDTDWWMDRLYDFADALSPTIVATSISRYVIDVNRDPSGASLYPGQATTELCPVTTFDGEPIYLGSRVPDEEEVARRRATFFDPYHAALTAALEATRARHGYAVLYDCHSIRSVVPRLFQGELPVFNIGTNGGTSCAPAIESVAMELASSSPYPAVLNGRFKGGWITRRHGRPAEHLHAIQMELAQRAYLHEEAPPWAYDDGKAERLRSWLAEILQAICETARNEEAR